MSRLAAPAVVEPDLEARSGEIACPGQLARRRVDRRPFRPIQ